MRGEEPLPERAVTLSLGLDLTIPPGYVADENWRMMIYKKIARASDDRALEETAREIADRFGEPPEAVKRLVAYSRLRARAERAQRHLHHAAVRARSTCASRRTPDRPGAPPRLRPQHARREAFPGRVLSLPSPAGDALLSELLRWLEDFGRKEAA